MTLAFISRVILNLIARLFIFQDKNVILFNREKLQTLYAMTVKQFEYQIDNAINYISSQRILLKTGLSIIVLLLFTFVFPKVAYLSVLFIILIFSLKIETNPDKIKVLKLLKQAKQEFKSGNREKAVELVFEAYKIMDNPVIFNIIQQLHKANISNEVIKIQMLTDELEKTKSDNLREILQEMIKVLKYLIEHKQQLKIIREKLDNLKKEQSQAPSHYLTELQNIIQRYQNLEKLEKSKIEFYTQLLSELENLKKAYYYRNKLENEYQYLRSLEEKLLDKSIMENLTAEQSDELIDFHQNYLKTLSQYAEEINRSPTQDAFESLRKDFEQKKNDLRAQ